MAQATGSYLKGFYDSSRALGAKAISSDFTMVIEGFETSANYLLCKQAPWPILTPQGEIEISMPLGMNAFQPQQIKTGQQGQVSFYETRAGNMEQALIDILTGASEFNAKVYEGTPEDYLRYKVLHHCFFQMDPVDRDWENRSQPLLFTGTMFYHYFGEIVTGNASYEYDPNIVTRQL